MGIVRKQSIYSSVFIYIGFIIGAVNNIILFPRFLSQEVLGLTRVLIDVSTLTATLASLGAIPVINKFFPFYKDYLPRKKNDLPFLAIITGLCGYLLFVLVTWLLKDLIVRKYSGNSPLFIDYFYVIYPLTFFILIYNLLEAFAWGLHKTIASNFLRETGVRIMISVSLCLYIFGWVDTRQFIELYGMQFAIPALVLMLVLWRTRELHIQPGFSSVSRRMGKRMFVFSSFVFSASVFSLLAKTIDVLIISSLQGLDQAGIFSIATFMGSLMEVPQRSMYSITTPILANAWKNRDIAKVKELYTKSSITLTIAGLAIFGVIWINHHNLLLFLGKDWNSLPPIIFILCMAKLADMVTGVNNQIIQTSNYWRFDFICSMLFVALSIILNYILQKRIGTIGAAYANFTSITLFNLARFIFIWIKFGIHPFSKKTVWVLLIGSGCILAVMQLPYISNIYLDTMVRTLLFCTLYGSIVIALRISEDVNFLWEMVRSKVRR